MRKNKRVQKKQDYEQKHYLYAQQHKEFGSSKITEE